MMLSAPTLKRFPAEQNEERILGTQYKLADNQFGLDTVFPDSVDIDEGKMCIWLPFADGNRRDGVGDLLEVEGIHTERHRGNPICLFDHGKQVHLPIGMAEDPVTKNYTVIIDPISRTARAQVFFYQGKSISSLEGGDAYDHAVFCEQLFDLIAKRYIRAGSIGYQVIRAVPLEADFRRGIQKGLHLQETLLLEVSAVVLPANQDTVLKALSLSEVCGKPLSPFLVKSLSPYAEKRPSRGFPMKKSEKGFVDRAVQILDILGRDGGLELTINQIATELNATPYDIRISLDELIRDLKVRKRFIFGDDVYFLADNTKSLRLKYRKNGEVMANDKKAMSDEQIKEDVIPDQPQDQEAAEEMYGSQVLRALHRDHSAMMSDYDAMLGPLENAKVRKIVEKKLATIDKDLSEWEALHQAEYPGYEPIAGAKDMEEEGEAAEVVETDSEEEEVPSPEEVVEGMEHKKTKDLRKKYSGKKLPEDEWKRCGRYERCKKEMCPECGEENCSCKKDMNEEVEEVRNDLEETGEELEDVEEMQDYEKGYIKGAYNFLTNMMNSRDWTDSHRMEAYHHGKNLLSLEQVHHDLNQVPPGTHVPPAKWKPGAGAEKALPSSDISPEKARQILHDGEVHGQPLTDKQRRMFGAAASRGKKSSPDDDNWHKAAPPSEDWQEEEMREPEHQGGMEWRKMCKEAGNYLMELSKASVLTDEHREKGMHWHKAMQPYSTDETQAGGMGPEQGMDTADAAKSLKDTFVRQGEQLAGLLQKLSAIGVN